MKKFALILSAALLCGSLSFAHEEGHKCNHCTDTTQQCCKKKEVKEIKDCCAKKEIKADKKQVKVTDKKVVKNKEQKLQKKELKVKAEKK